MKQFILSILIILLLAGCNSEVAAPIPKATDSPTPFATSTPSPSPTATELPVLQTTRMLPVTFYPLEKIELSPDIKVEELDSMMVYNAFPVRISDDELMSLAENIGIKEAALKRKYDSILIEGKDKKFIDYDKSNSFLYISFDFSDIESCSEKLSNEEYINIARVFLQQNNLLSEEYLKDGLIIENGIITKTKDGEEYSYPTEMTVTFRRKHLDGFTVGGAAPRISVYMDLKGNILQVTKVQRRFTPLTLYPLKSLEEALQDILDGKGNLHNDTPSSNGTVTSVELCYYNDNQKQQCYLLPVYYIKGKCGDDDFFAYVHAIKDEYLEYAN